MHPMRFDPQHLQFDKSPEVCWSFCSGDCWPPWQAQAPRWTALLELWISRQFWGVVRACAQACLGAGAPSELCLPGHWDGVHDAVAPNLYRAMQYFGGHRRALPSLRTGTMLWQSPAVGAHSEASAVGYIKDAFADVAALCARVPSSFVHRFRSVQSVASPWEGAVSPKQIGCVKFDNFA